MKTPRQGPKNRPPQPFSEVAHGQGRGNRAGFGQQLSQPATRVLNSVEGAYYQDVYDQQESQQQPQKQPGLLHTPMARKVDNTAHKYTVLEIANEASQGRLSRMADQAKDILLH